MKNFKFKSVLFAILTLFCITSFFMFAQPAQTNDIEVNAASCKLGSSMKKSNELASNEFLYTGEEGGNIPFSLFITKPVTGTTEYEITNYIPTFTSEVKNESAKSIYYYTMEEESRPYILLSSDHTTANKAYNTSVVFKFNDLDGKISESNSISKDAGFMDIEATVNGRTILIDRDSSQSASTDNSSATLAVNLQPLFVEGNNNLRARCPKIDAQQNLLGGNGEDNDISYRRGLYEIKIRYSHTDVITNEVSNECVFTISFFVLNECDYIPEGTETPFTFTNTNTYNIVTEKDGVEVVDSNYELFNYNYKDSPIVELDSTKFGMNFTYTSGYTNYIFKYQTFVYNYTPERIPVLKEQYDEDELKNIPSGYIVTKLKDKEITYIINTYITDKSDYTLRFDVEDFKKEFIVPNKVNTTYQGIYSFDLEFLIQNATSYSVVDKTILENVNEKIYNQKMAIFGYELMYYDQDPTSPTYKQDVPLLNDHTHTNFISYNTSSAEEKIEDNKGYFVDVPNYIAITDQAPLRFHSYGNLLNGYTAKFVMYDYKSVSEDEVLEPFKTIKTLETDELKKDQIDAISEVITSQSTSYYTQGASISGDNIRVMKLDYQLNLNSSSTESLEPIIVYGCQYIVFEINNTVQNLYVQSIEENTTYDFDTYTNKNVRVNLEQKPNTFYAPVQVTYSYSSNFDRSDISTSTTLYTKKLEDQKTNYEYTIDGKIYTYYVQAQTDNYTFSRSGYYKVSIRSVISNVPKVFSFVIDKNPFTNISLNTVGMNKDKTAYIKESNTLASSLLSLSEDDNNKKPIIEYDLFISEKAFTMSWKEKPSGASSDCYVYYMETGEDSLNKDSALFKIANGDYYLTNGLSLNTRSTRIDTYKNSVNVIAGSANAAFPEPEASNYYFNKDGLYFFYVFDEAGNFFTRVVLIDSSLSASLQGYWEGIEENSKWVNTFDPVKNPANYVNKDTTIYFGSHKALKMPQKPAADDIISFEDTSFTRAYDLSNNGTLIPVKEQIIIKFYEDILNKLTNYIKEVEKDDLIIGSVTDKDQPLAETFQYLILRNTLLSYEKTPTEVEDPQPISGRIGEIYKAKIYTRGDTSSYDFNGEAYYDFSITNINNKVALKQVCMNFDMVQGTFYAYGLEESEKRLIRKNSGTNLDFLRFEYNKLDDETAEFYSLKSLVYDYYEFVVDDSSSNSSKTTYPFAATSAESKTQVDLLSSQVTDPSNESVFVIDPINLSPSNFTMPGKYILTRVYKGGTHDYIGGNHANYHDDYVYVGEGGSYYLDSKTQTYINLFELDTLVRKYVVYVDHYGIVTSSVMIRDDGKENIREVGDNISVSLSYLLDEEWEFKEFFLTTSGTLSLDTNKVPVSINIPLSKYFVYYNSISENLYSKLIFAKLQISIEYAQSFYSEVITYNIDGYDVSTGLCTCSALVSNDNPLGKLIFNKEGSYTIKINDKTGYSDTSSNRPDANNINPTTFIYDFEISHTAPYTDVYTSVYDYQKLTFKDNKLTNEDNSTNFATNIKEQATESLKNEVYTTWSDPLTPYNAKVNQLDIEVVDPDTKAKTRISIDLKDPKFNLFDSAKNKTDLELTSDQQAFINYFKVSFYEDNENPSIYDYQEYYRYTYSISINIAKEYVYNITLSYVSDSTPNQSFIGDNGKSFADSLYKVTIDRTKPYTNIDSLIFGEEFLKQTYAGGNVQSIKEELFDVANLETLPSTFTYAFGVDRNFKLSYVKEDTAPYFYVRNYQKFEDQYISITPDMVDSVYDQSKAYYTDYSSFTISYPRFAEGLLNNDQITIKNYTWNRIYYNSNATLLSLISQATNDKNPTGFYEIIEKDLAGNYRCYTVYFSEFNNLNKLVLNIDGYSDFDLIIGSNLGDKRITEDNITVKSMYELIDLSSKFGWGKITLKNETIGLNYPTEINLNPFISYHQTQALLTEINKFFTTEVKSPRFSFTLSKYNSAFPSITRYLNIITSVEEAKLAPPTIEEVVNVSTGAVTYNLKFPTYTSTSVLFLEGLEINILQGKVWQNLYSYEGKANVPEKITGLQKGIYEIYYTDNYSGKYANPYILYVGEYYINNFNTEFNFEHSIYQYDSSKAIYYSGGDIKVTYEANIYDIWINGKIMSGNSSFESLSDKLGQYNCKTFTLTSDYGYEDIPAFESVGGETYYEIVYRDKTTNREQKRYKFIIYDVLPEILLTNAYGGEVTSTLTESSSQITSSVVYINWGKITQCDFEDLNDSQDNTVTTALLYTKNQNNEYKNGLIISENQAVTEEGYYKVELRNSKLGNYREIYFAIQFGDFPLYTITSNNKLINPSSLENLNFTSTDENQKAQFSSGDASDRMINVLYRALSTIPEISGNEFNSLKNQLGFKTGEFVEGNVGICSLKNIPHYYSINDVEIVYNSNIELNIVEFCFLNNILQTSYKVGYGYENPTPNNVGSAYWTTIYLVYNLDGPIRVEFFAVTKAPKTTALVNANIKYQNEKTGTISSIVLSTYAKNYTLTNNEIKNSDITLIWNKLSTNNEYWYNQGNAICVYDKYGVDADYYPLDCFNYPSNIDNKKQATTTLTGSGAHNLMFKDWAGNTHEFAPNTYAPQNYYSLLLIDSVIYHLTYNEKNYNPIQYGVFNDRVDLVLDEEYLQYYSNLNIIITRNGNLYSGATVTNNIYSFNESGRYNVQISASYGQQQIGLNKVSYNFTILNSNSARLAYEFVEIPGYEIIKVVKNNEDITNRFKVNGKITSLFLSSSQSNSGNGHYVITMKYGKRDNETLTYSFSINDYVPTITSNVPHGETTTGSIKISYNPSTIYEQLGECTIRILTYNNDSKAFYYYSTISIDEKSIVNPGASTFEITRSNSYFIQVQTKSGNVVSSFRVNKKDPLNAIAIIIIVAFVIAVIVLIIVVVKLRTKMKVR